MGFCSELLKGIVVETRTQAGPTECFLYSDKYYRDEDPRNDNVTVVCTPSDVLICLSTIPILGIAAGVTRMALAVIHSLGHLFAALVTFDKGHCVHAAKGGCEFLRGLIEATPIVGRQFARNYVAHGDWWMIKIYNPDYPDTLDRHMGNWVRLRQTRPNAYVVA